MMRVCPNCNMKSMTDSPVCSRCGADLPPLSTTRVMSLDPARTPAPPKGRDGGKQPAPPPPPSPKQGSGRGSGQTPQPPPPPFTEQPFAESYHAEERETPPPPPQPFTPPFSNSNAPVHQPNAPLAPKTPMVPVPYREAPSYSPQRPRPLPIAPSPIPANLSRYGAPQVEGEVTDTFQVQNKDREITSGDCLSTILSIFVMFINFIGGLMLLVGRMGRPNTYKTINHYRVFTPAGKVAEIRVERDFRDGGIRKGDYISAWGKKSGNTLIMKYGYNHTTETEIRIA